MLAVIADDFTGASEVAGIAFTLGHKTLIQIGEPRESNAGVLVVATNMRSQTGPEAAKTAARVTKDLLSLGANLIFKKIDSVLRGNIGAEIYAQMQTEGKSRALLVPANPSRSRTIADGIYYVQDVQVSDSEFAGVGGYPFPNSDVVDILALRGAGGARCISPRDSFAESGLHIGNTRDSHDIEHWASRLDDQLVPAGAADFFEALLMARGASKRLDSNPSEPRAYGNALYVCGSSFPTSCELVARAARQGVKVVRVAGDGRMGNGAGDESFARAARQIMSAMAREGRVIVATSERTVSHLVPDGGKSVRALAEVVRKVVSTDLVDDLLIEGGETSRAVMAALKIDHLYPASVLAPGVTCMWSDNHPELRIITKPGSYAWPDMVSAG